jgi:hypothetical protein
METTSFLGSFQSINVDVKQNITNFLDSQHFWTRDLSMFVPDTTFVWVLKQGGPYTSMAVKLDATTSRHIVGTYYFPIQEW